MKLNIVPARTGLSWIRQGCTTFAKRPFAFAALLLIYLAVVAILGIIPLAGGFLSLSLVPLVTWGFMVATREAVDGRTPTPATLVAAWRGTSGLKHALISLGVLYALAIVGVFLLSALFDGGSLARLALLGGPITPEMAQHPGFNAAMLFATLAYLPVTMAFWHAPALVYWHQIEPAKALFFSVVACWRNLGAFMLFGLGWLGAMIAVALVINLVVLFLGGGVFAAAFAMATMMLSALAFLCLVLVASLFTYLDCFSEAIPAPNAPLPSTGPAP